MHPKNQGDFTNGNKPPFQTIHLQNINAPNKQKDPYQDEPGTTHSQTAGESGPLVAQDGILHETLDNFVHSKIPERVVHTKGFGAFGYFQPFQSMKECTMLNFLQSSNIQTPVTVRFSLAVSTKGTADTSRNVRGMSTKFYTKEGIFDLLCNHIPVFLVRDAMRFPESIKSFLPSPKNNLADPNRFWDFIARTPEATHFLSWLYSDTGTIKSLRHIRTYGVNTYVWKNSSGLRTFVKYHWIPVAGEQNIDRFEAVKLAGENPDIAGQDLYDAIAKGEPVQFDLCVQLMNFEDMQYLPFDPLDDTKTWDEAQYPLVPVGRMVLNKNPDDFTEQIEKVAFSPTNLLEGAELSNDKMLQGRSFIYWDAQRYRLGPDFRKIPVNAQENWTPDRLPSTGLGSKVSGKEVRAEYQKTDNFAQAGERFHSLSPLQREHLVDNIASELYAVSDTTQKTVLSYLYEASDEFGNAVLKRMQMYANKEV